VVAGNDHPIDIAQHLEPTKGLAIGRAGARNGPCLASLPGFASSSRNIPTLVDQPPEGTDGIHEVKHDGYRTIVVVIGGKHGPTPGMDLTGATAILASSAQPRS
jgi:hypothetical protein